MSNIIIRMLLEAVISFFFLQTALRIDKLKFNSNLVLLKYEWDYDTVKYENNIRYSPRRKT